MDATYMQKDKIAHRCEIATIALTSRFQYETYAAYISMSHISADMTFALRTHCFFDGAYVRFLQSDVCAFSFSMADMPHILNATYVALSIEKLFVLMFLLVLRTYVR